MGFAHALIKMGIVYGSEESLTFAEQLATALQNRADIVSIRLAQRLGAFPKCEESKLVIPRRNAYLTSIAPTGTISVLADRTSFSIEPLFNVVYTRKVLGQSFTVVDPLFEEMIKDACLDYDDIIQKVKGKNTIQDLVDLIPERIRRLFVTAHDLTPIQHVDMVIAFQNHIDAGVSKTINMPNYSTVDDVDEVLKYAYEEGCKGITIYRDGSRDVPITNEAKIIDKEFRAPDVTYGVTERISVSCGHFLCNVSGVDEQPLKIINNATSGCCDSNLHALQRIISLAFRSGVSPHLVTKQLDKVKCDACKNNPNASSKSCAAGMSKVIKLYEPFIKSRGKLTSFDKSIGIVEYKAVIKCTNCNEEYEANTKCGTCPHCFFSRCG